jgi:putative flippase GtrA
MFKLKRLLQFIRFCVVGGIVAAIDLTTVWITSHFLPALVAVSLGYSTGATCHFLLNKFWVFRCDSRQYRRQLVLYLLHLTIYWLMTMLIVSLVLSTTAASVVVARVISIPPMMLFTFCSLRFVVFRKARLSPSPLRREACSTFPDARRVTTPDAEAYALRSD